MRKYIVPILLVVIMLVSFLYLLVDKFSTDDVHVLLERETYNKKLSPEQIKSYTAAVNELVLYANRCLTYATHSDGICRDSHALDLVRALKVSDSVYLKTHGFRSSPFQFFERKVAPQMGIQDLECRLENKKPVCKVVKG